MGVGSDVNKLILGKRRLQRHLGKMKAALPDVLEHAFSRFYETQPMTYLSVEKKAYHFEDLFLVLQTEVRQVTGMSNLRQVAGRVNYVADQLDTLESSVFKRARRRSRRPFNLADFIEKFTKQSYPDASSKNTEISSLSEAYETLDLEEGCNLRQVMLAFRRLAKKYHPDTRGGDRSDEHALQRVVAAYQVIKESLAA